MTNNTTPGDRLVERLASRLNVEKETVEDEIKQRSEVYSPHTILKLIYDKYEDTEQEENKEIIENRKARKQQAIKRDDYKCRNCGDSENDLLVTHIVPTDNVGHRHLTNMVTLCKLCYSKKEIDPSVRDAEYPDDWEKFRKKVYEKDYYTCQNCGLMGSMRDEGATELHAHHIVPLSKRGKNILSNCITLCKYCHKRCHYNMQQE